MFTSTTPYNKPLGNGLILKSISTLDEVNRLADFSAGIHEEQVGALTRGLILHHPHTRPEHWLFVEDEAAHKIVSTLCLIPWTWRCGDSELKVGELGICGTDAAYRNRGLVRALVGRLKELLHEGSYDISVIQGIPYFYRQFGYEYALPLEPSWCVQLHNIPATPPSGYRIRPAGLDDLPVLMRLYDEAAGDLDISFVRDEAVWRYLLDHADQTANLTEMWLVLDAQNQPAGYLHTTQAGFGQGLIVSETSRLNSEATVAVMGWLKQLAIERQKPEIRLNLPAHTSLVQTAIAWAGFDHWTYAWQIHIPDAARFLRRLTPLFEQRLAASPFAGLTQAVVLNLYREAVELRFERGKLAAVESLGFKDGGDINLPPLLLAPLALGYRTLKELSGFYPDVMTQGQSEVLGGILFPKMTAFLYTNY